MSTLGKIAVLGASGFIGSRIVEIFHLGGLGEVLPVVRGVNGLSRLSRFDIDWRVADALDETALTAAFKGCDCVIHSVLGQPEVIERSIGSAYRAASKAGCRRLIYLSTASVHGLAPPPGTDEASALSDRQQESYNNLKVRAERLLLRERLGGSVEVVILRPAVVFGPRDRWMSVVADELLRGTAYLVNGGSGICNSIYVDNLVQAIHLALRAEKVDGEAFLLGDRETVTWSDLYFSVAAALGVGVETIHRVAAPTLRKGWRSRIDQLRGARAIQGVLPLVPSQLKRSVKAAIAAWPAQVQPSPWTPPSIPSPNVTREIAELQQCEYKLPFEKASQMLGYEPAVSFAEGCRRSIEWLEFAGYPVVHAGQRPA